MMGKNDFKLSKKEILKGYDAFSKILANSRIFRTDLLTAYFYIEKKAEVSNSKSESPLLINFIKVGFIIAKKKIRKSSFRNRIKRLLKESYRLNKYKLNLKGLNVSIIFSLSDYGYVYFKNKPKEKIHLVNKEMDSLILQINKSPGKI